jgi:hypothetical protein
MCVENLERSLFFLFARVLTRKQLLYDSRPGEVVVGEGRILENGGDEIVALFGLNTTLHYTTPYPQCLLIGSGTQTGAGRGVTFRSL